MSEATFEQANLQLKLYDLRREPRLREAREWFSDHFHPQSLDEVMKICPPGSKENAFMRQVLSYWEMVASMSNRGLLNEDLLFDSGGEEWATFQQVKPVPRRRAPRGAPRGVARGSAAGAAGRAAGGPPREEPTRGGEPAATRGSRTARPQRGAARPTRQARPRKRLRCRPTTHRPPLPADTPSGPARPRAGDCTGTTAERPICAHPTEAPVGKPVRETQQGRPTRSQRAQTPTKATHGLPTTRRAVHPSERSAAADGLRHQKVKKQHQCSLARSGSSKSQELSGWH